MAKSQASTDSVNDETFILATQWESKLSAMNGTDGIVVVKGAGWVDETMQLTPQDMEL